MWGDQEYEEFPEEHLLNAFSIDVVRRGRRARYRVSRLRNGWSQRFESGDEDMRGHNCDYVSNESVETLQSWWNCEFDRTHMLNFDVSDPPREEICEPDDPCGEVALSGLTCFHSAAKPHRSRT